MMGRRGVALATMLAALAWVNPAHAKLCYTDSDETSGAVGVPVAWENPAAKKIDYYTYIPAAARVPDKAKVLAAIKAAFDAYTDIPCSSLQFNHAGEMDPLVTEKPGAIVVFFGSSTSDWVYGTSTYWFNATWTSAVTGFIEKAFVGMNAKDYDWTTDGAVANKLDVQTVLTKLLPGTLGFFVGDDPGVGKVTIKLNEEDRAISAEQTTGAQFVYYKADTGCTKPADPEVCPPSGTPTVDAGPTGDGGGTGGDGGGTTGRDGGGTTGKDGGGTTAKDGGGTTGSDGGVAGGDGAVFATEDDGCCRVSHARNTSLPLLTLVGLGLLLGLTRRRWRR